MREIALAILLLTSAAIIATGAVAFSFGLAALSLGGGITRPVWVGIGLFVTGIVNAVAAFVR